MPAGAQDLTPAVAFVVAQSLRCSGARLVPAAARTLVRAGAFVVARSLGVLVVARSLRCFGARQMLASARALKSLVPWLSLGAFVALVSPGAHRYPSPAAPWCPACRSEPILGVYAGIIYVSIFNILHMIFYYSIILLSA